MLFTAIIYLTWYCWQSATDKYAFIILVLILFFYLTTLKKLRKKPGEAAKIDEITDDLYNLYLTHQPPPRNEEGNDSLSRLFLAKRKGRIGPHAIPWLEPLILVVISQDDIRIIKHPETEEARKKEYSPSKIEKELEELQQPLLIQVKGGRIINITKW